MKYQQEDKVVLLVDKKNLTWPPGSVIYDYDGNKIDVPEVFHTGTVGHVLVALDNECQLDIFLDGDDLKEHLGTVWASHNEMKAACAETKC